MKWGENVFFNEQRNKISGPAKAVVQEGLCVCSHEAGEWQCLCRIPLQSRGTAGNTAASCSNWALRTGFMGSSHTDTLQGENALLERVTEITKSC